jgi:preprotein translocase subunit SecG
MITLLTVFHIIVCIFLIFVVLLQQSSGADWAGAFGGGGSQTTFGARGRGTALGKATTVAAVIFMLTSLGLAILVSQPGRSSVIREGATQAQPQPQQMPRGQQQNTSAAQNAPATPTTSTAPQKPGGN